MSDINITVDSTEVVTARQELRQMAEQALATARATRELTQGNPLQRHFETINRQITEVNRNMQMQNRLLNQSTGGMNSMGVVVQQTGYQVGDFLVQIQSGTNWLVAFGQQATQLAGLMTTFGGKFIYLGTALGIAIPLVTALGAAWMRTSQETEQSATAMEKAVQSLKSEVESLNTEIAKVRFGTESSAQANALAEIERLTNAIAEAQIRYNEAAQALQENEFSTRAQGRLGAAAEELQILRQQLRELEGQLQVSKETEVSARNIVGSYQFSANYIAIVAERALEAAEETDKLKNDMSQAALEALEFAGVDLASGVSAAAQKAAELAGFMRISLSDALSLINLRESRVEGRVGARGDPRQFMEGGSQSYSSGARPFVADIPRVSRSRSGGGLSTPEADPLAELRKEIELEKELLTVNEAMARVIKAVGEDRKKYSDAELQAVAAEIQAYEMKKQALEEQQRLGEFMKSSMEDAFMSIIDGTASAKDAFKKFAYDVIRELYRVLVVQQMVGQFQIGGGGILGSLAGLVGFRESGGSVMPGQPYIVGERGPELIVPRHSGTVLNSNLTSKAMSGGGEVTVNQTINISTGVQQTVRNEIKTLMPQIADSAKAAVLDAKRRGGSYGRAF